jgi:hypothetical protein
LALKKIDALNAVPAVKNNPVDRSEVLQPALGFDSHCLNLAAVQDLLQHRSRYADGSRVEFSSDFQFTKVCLVLDSARS